MPVPRTVRRPAGADKKASPPVLSQEFFIQNHADIFSCITILILIGMMAPVTNWLAVPFVAMTSNVTTQEELQADPGRPIEYTTGFRDVFAVIFYAMVCIIMHQIIQEYIVDKITRRLHLSKLRTSRFSESAQLVCFYLITFIWAVDLMVGRGYLTNHRTVWENYPHSKMLFHEKFFMVLQLAHWVHTYAELYLQKVKKEDMQSRLIYQTINLVVVLAAYMTNFHRLLAVLMLVESAVQVLFHSAKILHYSERNRWAAPLFSAFNAAFVFSRFLSVALSGYVMLYALKPSQISSIDRETGNYNTPFIKVVAFAGIVVLNFWMLTRFLTFHFRRRRERTEAVMQRKKLAGERRSKASSTAVRGESSDDAGDYERSPESSPKAAAASSNSPRSQNNAAGRIRTKGNKSE
ncbi:hypothetical protein RvY_13823 [Ramazzottius varieornatus]|uniref:TLC domain-containing protein n=1 Tax=Ramazzottius varieornatus TaxID=947166 RepID=A0A1D1VWM7_RAMVA|nr:hypothetical protein RvY_13823 [Ramazzottius varieornatus]